MNNDKKRSGNNVEESNYLLPDINNLQPAHLIPPTPRGPGYAKAYGYLGEFGIDEVLWFYTTLQLAPAPSGYGQTAIRVLDTTGSFYVEDKGEVPMLSADELVEIHRTKREVLPAWGEASILGRPTEVKVQLLRQGKTVEGVGPTFAEALRAAQR